MVGGRRVLVWVLIYVAVQGSRRLNCGFLTETPPGNPSDAGGGFYNGIIGSLIIVGIAALIGMPLGIGGAIYLVQYAAGRFAAVAGLFTECMLGIPTIVTGRVHLCDLGLGFGFSGFAGSLALAIVMVPLIVRATEEMLRLVPRDIREAVWRSAPRSRARSSRSCSRPHAPGIITGVMLAVARAMGETAPLLLTALGNDLFTEYNPGKRMSTLSLQIFDSATGGFPAAQARAWAGALTLIAIVLLLTIFARLIARKSAVGR